MEMGPTQCFAHRTNQPSLAKINQFFHLRTSKIKVLSKAYFNIICMSRAINMGIVSLSSLIFHMGLQSQIGNQRIKF